MRSDGGDTYAETAPECGEDDLAGCRGSVFTEQVQRLIDDDRVVDANKAPRAKLALHDGMDLVGAATLRVFLTAGGKFKQAVTVDRAKVGFCGFCGHGVLQREGKSANLGCELPLTRLSGRKRGCIR